MDRSRLGTGEIDGATAFDAYELVQQLRPEWLRARPPFGDPRAEAEIVVFMNGSRHGLVESLRNISLQMVGSMEYLSGSAVQQEFTSGSGRNVVAVIHVYSPHLAEQRQAVRERVVQPSEVGIEFAVYRGTTFGHVRTGHGERFSANGWERLERTDGPVSSIIGSARLKVHESISVEVLGSHRLDNHTESYARFASTVHYLQTSNTAGALVSYQWKAIRIGAGAGFDIVELHWAAGQCRCASRGRVDLSFPGLLFDAALLLPTSSRLFGGFRVQHGAFQEGEVRTFGSTPTLHVGGSRWYVGLGGGLRFGAR